MANTAGTATAANKLGTLDRAIGVGYAEHERGRAPHAGFLSFGDTRAFLSIPARHDVARRVDCTFLATLVAEHLIGEEEAERIARELAYDLVKQAYRL